MNWTAKDLVVLHMAIVVKLWTELKFYLKMDIQQGLTV